MDLNKIFNNRYAILISLIASIITLISWGFEISYNGQIFLKLWYADTNYSDLSQIGPVALQFSMSWLRIVLGTIFSFLMLIFTFYLMLKNEIIVLDNDIMLLNLSNFQVSIILIIISIINFWGTSGFIIGSILGIVAGAFIIVAKYIGSESPTKPRGKTGSGIIEVDIS
jgi:hypothetical protein